VLFRSCTIFIDPALIEKNLTDVGSAFDVRVSVQNVADLFGFDFNVTWNNALITLRGVEYSSELDSMWGSGNWTMVKNETGSGWYKLVATSTASGFTGTKSLAKLTFRVEYSAVTQETPIHFEIHKLSNSHWTPIQHTAIDGTYRITVQIFTLTVMTVGQGSVNLNSSGPYHYGDVVQLTAVPATGWSFDHWSGNLTGYVNPATLVITGNMSVTATFTQNVYTLAVNVVGHGTVGLNISEPYHYGDAVRLTASADIGWTFHYWSGDLSGSANPATLVMTGNFSVTAYFAQRPTLQMSPAGKTCRTYGESFTVTIVISNAVNVEDFAFEIHYNTTLLDYVDVTWGTWGHGTISVDEVEGRTTGSTSGTAINGTQNLLTIAFQAAYHHVWKSAPDWTNDLIDTIFLQEANVSYPSGPDLRYKKGGLNQINVGPDFAYTFSPIQGDVDNNGTVNVFDLRSIGAYYNAKQGDPNWTGASTYDLNGDGVVDTNDLRIAEANFGYKYIL
jgi:hypothetical protein